MVRFAYLQEVYLYEVYRETIARGGHYRYQARDNPLTSLPVADDQLHKCLTAQVEAGRIEFRHDPAGSHDGYEISASGLIHIEDQFEEFEDRPRDGTMLQRALQAAYGDAGLPAAVPAQQSSIGRQHVRFVDAQDAVAAVACAIAAEFAETTPGTLPSCTAVYSRARLLASPQTPAALVEALASSAVERLAAMGYAESGSSSLRGSSA